MAVLGSQPCVRPQPPELPPKLTGKAYPARQGLGPFSIRQTLHQPASHAFENSVNEPGGIGRPSAVVQVLNVGHAKLVGKVKIGALTSLGAVILNDNALTSISGETHPLGCILASLGATALHTLHHVV